MKNKPKVNKSIKPKPKPKGKPSIKPDVETNPQGDTGTAQDRALNKLYTPEGNAAGSALIQKLNPNGFGHVSTELTGAGAETGRLQGLADKYANPSAEQTDVQARMKAGLGGYTSPEMQGMREQQEAAQNSNLATATSQLAKQQARGRVYGAAAQAGVANVNQASLNSKNDQAQKLMIANADEQQKRLGTYGAYNTQLQNQGFTQQSQIAKGQNDLSASQRAEGLDREKINLGQDATNTATNIGLYTGAAGTAVSAAQNAAANKIAQSGINAIAGKPSPTGAEAAAKAAGAVPNSPARKPAAVPKPNPVQPVKPAPAKITPAQKAASKKVGKRK